jgi:hypothetical protein
MEEQRRAMRLTDDNEITVTVVPGKGKYLKEKFFYNYSKDVSVSGARINAHIFLPIDTLLMIEMTIKTLRQIITVIGKVKWIKVVFEDESYEAGVEFFNTPPSDGIKKLADYISWKQKSTSLYPA